MKLEELSDETRLTPDHYLAIRSDGLSFASCVTEAIGCTEMVSQVDRLYGTNLLQRGAPIDLIIDKATGKTDTDMQTFLRFVWNCVFIRCAAIPANPPRR